MAIYYRIFEDKGGAPHTLFHGISGSRKIPLDNPVDAETKFSRDGTGKRYKTGFHVLKDKDAVTKYLLSRFKNMRNKVICKVHIFEDAGTWPKKHSKSPIILAKRMLVTSKDWQNRTKFV